MKRLPGVPVQQVTAPANLTADCADPVALADDSMGAMADALTENTAALVDCKKRHNKLSSWVKGSPDGNN